MEKKTLVRAAADESLARQPQAIEGNDSATTAAAGAVDRLSVTFARTRRPSAQVPMATIGDAIEKITHTGAHAADAKVEPGAPASGSPKVVEGEVVKPPPS